jgi:ferric-dicitrate binding protein FerR (iron transport regulator)
MTQIRCEDARLLISRELDHELPAADLSRLGTHLEHCAPCRAERAGFQRVDALVTDALAAHPFDQSMVRDIVRMAESRHASVAAPRAAEPPRGLLVKFRAAGLVVAAAAAVVAVGLSLQSTAPIVTGPETEARPVVARAYGTGLRIAVDGKQTAIDLAPGQYREVHSGELILNGGGRVAALVLEDGTRVDMRPDTAVTLRRERDGGTTVALTTNNGEVFCEVAKQNRPFRVTSGSLTATVLGTKFFVRSTGRESSVGVIEGRVRVASPSEQVVLSARQEAILGERPLLVARPLANEREQLVWNPRILASLATPVAPAAPTAPNATAVAPAPVASPTTWASPTDGLDDPVAPPKKK